MVYNMIIKGKEYTLKYNFTALTIIEENGVEIDKLEEGINMKTLSVLFYAGLNANYKLTREQTNELLDDITDEQGILKGMELVGEEISKAMGVGK